MEEENSAHGAQRGSIARRPTGFRRLTPGLLKADRTAEGFEGLPDGVTSPGQLLAAFKAAAARLGVAPRLVHALDWLFRFTQPQDWQEGRIQVMPGARRRWMVTTKLSPVMIDEKPLTKTATAAGMT